MLTPEEVEERFLTAVEYLKVFEQISQEQRDEFQVHIGRIKALQFLMARIQELKVYELDAILRDKESKAVISDVEVVTPTEKN